MFDTLPLNDTSQLELQTQLFMRTHRIHKTQKFLLNYIINITVDMMNDSK